ncbi:MAG: hypothetical protein QOI24_618 [Acidobacteriota bacterium]|nr:hypothetical protein [Acidobacteriota bacterium]
MRKAGFVFTVLLLAGMSPATAQEVPNPPPERNPNAKADADHSYPSAKVCGECHPNQYKQWSNSSHAYASLSPMFNKFEQRINDLSQGTVNYFCVRCHASVGTALGERRDIAWWDRSAAAQEGITCVTCHRAGEVYGKTNAARRITPGSIHEPVFGPFDTTGGLKAISNARWYQVLVGPDEPDRPIEADKTKWIRMHQTAIQSQVMVKSEFCVSCHQVQVHPGIKLETVWEEYRASPAAREGISCQDCHMSTSPGQNTGYAVGWAARVNNKYVNLERKLTDHTFVGPGYPISHPGLFPFNKEESPFTPQQWLKFDYRAEWGSDDFENKVAASPSSYTFPAEWQNAADRKTARVAIEANLVRWRERREQRIKLLENGSRLEGPVFAKAPEVGKPFSFSYKLTNLNKGHNLPSGSLGAQPELWVDIALIDPDGKRIWESGYVDSHGDVADFQSFDVRAGKIAHDDQLVSMQAKFITTNLKGTDREMYLPINLDFDQLPFIRPGGTPNSLLNHPPNARMEKRSIPPLGSRDATYKVPGALLSKPGTYRLAVRLRGRTEPIYFMDFVGATKDMIRAENEWATDTHASAVEFEIRPQGSSEVRMIGAPPAGSFGPDPGYDGQQYDADEQLGIYGSKHMNRKADPPIELGIRLYDRGAYAPRPTWLGAKNPIGFHFLGYGDLRIAAAAYDNGIAAPNGKTEQTTIAARLNLDLDLALTATERFHAFVRPLDKGGSFTRYQISGGVQNKFIDEFDFDLDTLFFEGDLGAMRQGLTGKTSRVDLPITIGRVPLLTQNGIWLEDAFDGVAFAITAKSNAKLDISNMDFTFFAGFNGVTTDAVPGNKAKVFGVAGFADLLKGYAEYGYGYVRADDNNLSYHNVTAAFTRRYFGHVANSVRLIGNFGQTASPGHPKTADGLLVLLENSFFRSNPVTLVPYVNLFAGFNSPQSLARGADSGGVLRNTGINFESDGLTRYPTLDARAHDSYGGAVGLEYLFNLDRQIVVEGAVVERMGGSPLGSEYALGARYQHPITNAWLIRLDAMRGWRQGQKDVYGARVEIRRKF